MTGWFYDGEQPFVTSDIFFETSGADLDLRFPTSDLPGSPPASWGDYCMKIGGPSTAFCRAHASTAGGMLDAFTVEFEWYPGHDGTHAWHTYPFSCYSDGFFANELWLRDGFYTGSSEHLQVAVGYYSDNFEVFDVTTDYDRVAYHHIKMSITSTPTPHLKVWYNSSLAIDTTLAGQFWSSDGAPSSIVPEPNILAFGGFHGTAATPYFDNIRVVPYEATSDPQYPTTDCMNMVAVGVL